MASNNVKVIGIRNAVRDINRVPAGFHVEVWSRLEGGKVRIWTSEYLSDNSWTVGHDADEHELDWREEIGRAEYFGESISKTEALRRAVARVYEVA